MPDYIFDKQFLQKELRAIVITLLKDFFNVFNKIQG